MKPVRIQFVEPRAWARIVGCLAVACIAIAGVTAWRWMALHQVRQSLQSERDALQRERTLPPSSPTADPRAASGQMARHRLQWDWNRPFDAIEQAELAQVRLLEFSLDVDTGEARLVYELDSMVQGTDVTAALNAFGPGSVWRLERLAAAGPPGGTAGGAAGHLLAGKVTGTWRARLD